MDPYEMAHTGYKPYIQCNNSKQAAKLSRGWRINAPCNVVFKKCSFFIHKIVKRIRLAVAAQTAAMIMNIIQRIGNLLGR